MVKTFSIAAIVVACAAGTAAAQVAPPSRPDQVNMRQRIATMEAILQQAVTNGADNVLRQVQNVMPDRPMLNGAPRAKGTPLDRYGVFFHVQVPGLILPIMWPLRQMTFDSQNRSALITLQRLQTELSRLQPGEERARLQQLMRDLEAQLDGIGTRGAEPSRVSAASVLPDAGSARPPVDPAVVEDPQSAYTREVKAALIEAMLENSQGLPIGDDEWLVVAASDDAPRNPLFPGDSVDSSQWVMYVKGSDLAALRSKSIGIEEARKRVIVREE